MPPLARRNSAIAHEQNIRDACGRARGNRPNCVDKQARAPVATARASFIVDDEWAIIDVERSARNAGSDVEYYLTLSVQRIPHQTCSPGRGQSGQSGAGASDVEGVGSRVRERLD